MKAFRRLFLITGLFCALVVHALTPVHFAIKDATDAGLNVPITITSLPKIQGAGGSILAYLPTKLQLTNGVADTNLYSGFYNVSIQGVSKGFSIYIEDTTNTVNAADRLLSGISYLSATNLNAAIYLVTSNLAGILPGGSNGMALVYTNGNVGWMTVSADLTSATNNDAVVSNGVYTVISTALAGKATPTDITNTVQATLIGQNVLSNGAAFDVSGSYAFDLTPGQQYMFVSTNGDGLLDGDGETLWADGSVLNEGVVFTPNVATGMIMMGTPSTTIKSKVYRQPQFFAGNFQGDGSLLGGVAKLSNNGSDYDITALRNNIGVQILSGASYITAISNGAPNSAFQPAIIRQGGNTFFVISGSTSKGDYTNSALALPSGISNVGDPNGLMADITDSIWHLNYGASGRFGSSDSMFHVRNGATSRRNSGGSIGPDVMGVNPANGTAVLIDAVGTQFTHTPSNKVYNIWPANSMLVFNTNSSVKGFVIGATRVSGLDTIGGNTPFFYADFQRGLIRYGRWFQGIYQPDDVTYNFTVSGITVAPQPGDLYTNNNMFWEVISNNISGGSGTILMTGQSAPSASGTLGVLKEFGTNYGNGDASITFSAASLVNKWSDVMAINPAAGSVAMTNVKSYFVVSSNSVAFNGLVITNDANNIWTFFCNGVKQLTIGTAGTSLRNSAGANTFNSSGLSLDNGSYTVSAGDFSITQVGRGFKIKEGTNARMGTATLSSGTVTVANTSVTANSRFVLTPHGSTISAVGISAQTAGTSFTIKSSSGSDANTVDWIMFEPAP